MDHIDDIATDLLDILPNPVLVKDKDTRYLWVNQAFEALFEVRRGELVGRLDSDVFPDRQVAQCNGGDLRVLSTGELDEATEVVIDPVHGEREMITRKIRKSSGSGDHVLLGVMHDITEVSEANRRLRDASEVLEQHSALLRVMADFDSLTGCLNRRAMIEAAESVFAGTIESTAMLLIDLDHFKSINDSLGHAEGDNVLRHFAQVARSVLRQGDIIARIGGDEFAVLLADTPKREAHATAVRIGEAVRSAPLADRDGEPIHLTVSIGVAHTSDIDDGASSVEVLLQAADVAMYQAKGAGRDRSASASS